jgi:transcription elongation GreA/GreB family factor
MLKKIIVTAPSYKIRKEKYDRYSQRILEVQRDKEEARSQGDLSENFGYVEAKKTEENLRKMQGDLQLDLPIEVVDPANWSQLDMEDMPRAMLGAYVEIKRNNKLEGMLIGGAWDADLDNPKVISYTSPLAKAIIPKTPGFKTTLETNGDSIELISSKTPTQKMLEELYITPEKEKSKKLSKDILKPSSQELEVAL